MIFVTFLSLGILFRVFKRVEVLAGYEDSKVADRDGLAIWVGNICLRASCFYGVVTAILWLTDLDLISLRMRVVGLLILGLPILAIAFTILVGFDQFMKPPGADS